MKSLTGARGHRVIIDDAHSVEGALSDADRETTLRVFRETVQTRLISPEHSAIVVVMQRLHEKDVSGHIIENENYTHLCLPMEYEPDMAIANAYYKDPRTQEGELMFPSRFPKHVVERDKKAMGSMATAGQLQQRPSPRGGTIFKDSWWKYFKEAPSNAIRKIQFWDCAQKPGITNDYSACATIIQTPTGFYVIDVLRSKWEGPDLERASIEAYNKHRPNGIVIEDASAGSSLIQSLRRKGYPVLEYRPGKKDKVTRAIAATPSIEAGNWHLKEDAAWLEDFKSEFRQFGPKCAHDDMVDTISIAYNWFHANNANNYRIEML
jgi:predicted phage terminase large subunit-like protein